jgi:hypothetical protein
MIKPMRIFLVVTIALFFLFATNLYAQLSYQFNSELGYYNSTSSVLREEEGLLTRLEGKLSYLYENDNSSASFNVKARPEFFGLNKQLTSFKFKGGGEYSRREDAFDWSINFSRQLNTLVNSSLHLNYDIFSLQGNATLFSIDDFPISSAIGYAYQNVNSGSEQNLDLIFFEAKINQIIDSYIRTGYGIYAEKFKIENDPGNNYQTGTGSNSGYRFGPEVELNYLKDFLINFQYRFLFHASDVTSFPSYEQWIKLVAGKIMMENISAFLLINIYLRKYKNVSSNSDQLSILYTPINQENYINFKATYDFSESFNLYFKGGYFKENLIYNNYSFEGWDFVIGIELSNWLK